MTRRLALAVALCAVPLRASADPCVFDAGGKWAALHEQLGDAPKAFDAVRWDKREHSLQGILPSGDTVVIELAGCDHLGLTATMTVRTWPNPLPDATDRPFWLDKARELAELTDWFDADAVRGWAKDPSTAAIETTPTGFAIASTELWGQRLTVDLLDTTAVVAFSRMYD